MLTIQSSVHPYQVVQFPDLAHALQATENQERAIYLVDAGLARQHPAPLADALPADRVLTLEASEEQKSFERLTPIFLDLLKRGLKRDGSLVVIGGGVLQDIGCFISSVLFRGLHWQLLPTTLLAQADSCIGSKSSINIGPYKNQIGTFYPPNRVLVAVNVLGTLAWDEIRSGFGEVIKLQLLTSETGFRELLADLADFSGQTEILAKWVQRSLEVKQPYIETDERDRGVRNLLNYGHTFGHAYESATHYAIPHGISVILGMLTATHLSARLGLVDPTHFDELALQLQPWFQPYGEKLRNVSLDAIIEAIKHDKKSAADGVHCILTRGPGKMEKRRVSLQDELIPALQSFLTSSVC